MLAENITANIPEIIRTYRGPGNQCFNCRIWEAARATTATPKSFDPMIMGHPGMELVYIDGGFGRNNPVNECREEAKDVFPDQPLMCVISLGCGHPSTVHIPKDGVSQRSRFFPVNIIQTTLSMAQDCE